MVEVHHLVTTRELLTGATKMWQKTVEAFCGFGRVVGVIRQRGSVVCTLLNRSFVGAHSRVRGLPTGSMWAYRAIQVAAHATWWCLPTWKCSATWIFQNQVDIFLEILFYFAPMRWRPHVTFVTNLKHPRWMAIYVIVLLGLYAKIYFPGCC